MCVPTGGRLVPSTVAGANSMENPFFSTARDVLAPSAEGSIGVRMKGCTPIIHPTTKPPPILSSPASGTKIASVSRALFTCLRSFSGHDVATPLLRSAHCSAV